MRTAIVAGAHGLVGKSLTRRLEQLGIAVTALGRADGDLRDSASWAELPAADVVFQLAARAFVPESWREPRDFVGDNLAITNNAMDYCRRHKAKMVHASSYLYGNPDVLPIPETAPIRVLNPYALSKKLCEELVADFAAMFAIPAAIVRPFNIYGPGQDARFLLPSIVHQARHGERIEVLDLQPRRDYIHVDDVTDLLIAAARADTPFDIFNGGSGESHSVGEVIDIVRTLIDRPVSVVCADQPRMAEILDTRADITKARELLGWTPKVSLRDGLAMLIAETN